ncbi:hypothetical protein SCHIN_v1c03000 [Spiroplasma chinense]|uniref:Transmembrane protein n=1 Tax=Spiroplasma chinense TaxID=216932 RepID=A0A5B9Y5F9_9MOLU|nr:hypothetical protein [Spiroplasma chinense]QEH61497.1 hypothetical protein SCHIN_v1c03000 [Spiroplasma chinense]
MEINKKAIKQADKKFKNENVYRSFIKKMIIFFFFVCLISLSDKNSLRNVICIYLAFSSYLLMKKLFIFKQDILNEVEIQRMRIVFIKKIFVFLFYSMVLYILPAWIFTFLYSDELWLTNHIFSIQFSAMWAVILFTFLIVDGLSKIKNIINIDVLALIKTVLMKVFIVSTLIEKIKRLFFLLIEKIVKKLELKNKEIFTYKNTQKLKIHKRSIEVIGF